MIEPVQTFVVVRANGKPVGEVENTNCFWCGNQEFVCSACSAKAERLRQSHRSEA